MMTVSTPNEGRVLGIDWGEKRIGIALSDHSQWIATVWGLLNAKHAQDWSWFQKLREIIESESVVQIVMGLPLNMNGTEGPQAERVRLIGRKIEAELQCPVDFFDERLTTESAEATLIEAGLSREKRKKVRDGLSAQIFLQTYLNARKGGLK